MRLIYQNAQRVIVWLGLSNSQIDCLFDWMAALDQQVLTVPRPHTMNTWENEWLWVTWNLRGKYPPDDIGEALIELLRHEWFLRVWVLQEAALAKSAIITCGRNEVNSRAFVVMPSLLSVQCGGIQQSRLDILPGLLRAKSWWGESSDKSLIKLIQKFGKSEASDPRDIIYALLGLSADTHSSEVLRPDYQISLEEAIQRSVAYFMIQTHDLSKHTPVQTLPKWDIDMFRVCLNDLSFSVFRWATHNAQDLLLYDLLISQRDKQDVELIKRYMNCSGEHGPPILIALKKENMPLIELLMEFPGVNFQGGDSYGDTPLSIAVGQGNTIVRNFILGSLQSDHYGAHFHRYTPRFVADEGMPDLVENKFHYVEFDTPLLTAVKQGDSAAVEMLMDRPEESLYVIDCNGDGLLNIAARRGDENILDLLKPFDRHVLSLRGSDGLTPSESALVRGSPGLIEIFLDYHDHAVQRTIRANQFEFLRRILDIRPRLADESWPYIRRPLAVATWAGNMRQVKLLLDKGADINSRISTRLATPLWIAVSSGNLRMVRLLVQRGADIELMAQEFPTKGRFNLDMVRPFSTRKFKHPLGYLARDWAIGNTWVKPIWIAASLGYADIVSFLVQHQADIESRDSYYGLSPFWRAAQQDQPKVMRVLIEGGASIRPNRLVGWGGWREETTDHRRAARPCKKRKLIARDDI